MGAGAGRRPEQARLEAALFEIDGMISKLRKSVDASEKHGRQDTQRRRDVLDSCSELRERARQEADHGSAYVAYDCIHRIERELVDVMSNEERDAQMIMYVAEANEKVASWRAAAASDLVASLKRCSHATKADPAGSRQASDGTASSTNPCPHCVAMLKELMRNVHTAQQNKQHKIELIQQQQRWLLGLFVLAIAALGLAVVLVRVNAPEALAALLGNRGDADVALLLYAGMAAGFLGGLLSVAFSSKGANLDAKIPMLRWGNVATITRPAIGAVSAVPIVLLQQSGIIAEGAVSAPMTIVLCFVGGFSERWFTAQLDRLAGASESKS